MVTLSVGGRALCGAPNSRNKLYPPSLLPVTDESTSEVLEVLKYRMFDIGYKAGPMDGELRSTCLASILMHLRQMVDEFTEEHRIVKSILKVASRLMLDQKPLELDNLLSWGDLIKEDWTTRNATAVTGSIEQLSSQVATLEGRLIVTQEQVKCLAKELASTNESLRLMSGMMKEVVRFVKAQELKTFVASPTAPNIQASPENTSKRPRINYDERLQSTNASVMDEIQSTIAQTPTTNPASASSANVFLNGKAAPTIRTLKDLTLQDMIVNWYELEIFKSKDVHCENRTLRDKVRTTMKFIADKVLTADDREHLRGIRPTEDQPLQYTLWRNNLRSRANEISERAFRALEDIEVNMLGVKGFSRASNVTSLYDRLTAVKQKQEDAQTKVASASIEKYFK